MSVRVGGISGGMSLSTEKRWTGLSVSPAEAFQ